MIGYLAFNELKPSCHSPAIVHLTSGSALYDFGDHIYDDLRISFNDERKETLVVSYIEALPETFQFSGIVGVPSI